MKYLLLILFSIACFIKCKNIESSKSTNTTTETYSFSEYISKKKYVLKKYYDKVDSTLLLDLDKKSRWILYSIHCDDSCKLINTKYKNEFLTFGQLPLKLDTIFLSKDTIQMFYYFHTKDNMKCNINSISNWNKVCSGITYNAKNGKVLCVNMPNNTCFYVKFSEKRMGHVKELTKKENFTANAFYRILRSNSDEVVKYIINNKHIIDEWFRTEAIERGIL